MTRRTTAEALRTAVASYFAHKGFACHFEIGIEAWGRRRADMLAINLRTELILVEIKSGVQDFVTDKKWHNYVGAANKMYFAFTQDTFLSLKDSGRLEPLKERGVGVLVLSPSTGYLCGKMPAKRTKMEGRFKKYLVTRLAWRGGISKRTNKRRVRVYL